MIPRFKIYGATTFDQADETYEGWCLQVVWFGMCFELTLARIER